MTMPETRTAVLVAGGGLGGVAAALTAARLGHRVVLTEETDWLGGQLTSQAVPPDENPWIESRYASTGYRALRARIRDYYRRNYPLRAGVAADRLLNPGLGVVSGLCHEPRVAVAVLDELLAPYRTAGLITVLLRHAPVAAEGTGDRVEAVTFRRPDGTEVVIEADYVVDATELGDLLPLTGTEHVVGAEGAAETGEPHAAERPDPLDQQAISWCFPLEYRRARTTRSTSPPATTTGARTSRPSGPARSCRGRTSTRSACRSGRAGCSTTAATSPARTTCGTTGGSSRRASTSRA